MAVAWRKGHAPDPNTPTDAQKAALEAIFATWADTVIIAAPDGPVGHGARLTVTKGDSGGAATLEAGSIDNPGYGQAGAEGSVKGGTGTYAGSGRVRGGDGSVAGSAEVLAGTAYEIPADGAVKGGDNLHYANGAGHGWLRGGNASGTGNGGDAILAPGISTGGGNPGKARIGSGGSFGAIGQAFTAQGDGKGLWQDVVSVRTGSPIGGGYITPLVFDDATGRPYGWTGADYVQIGGPV